MGEWMMYRYQSVPSLPATQFVRPKTANVNVDPLSLWDNPEPEPLARTLSNASVTLVRSNSIRPMDGPGGKTASISSSSTSGTDNPPPARNQLILRHGRRYLRDLPYPLPVDLPEMQRQNLSTLLATTIFGKALCSPYAVEHRPRKVLEIACGSGYWSSLCHDYFCTLGWNDVSFTGLDIVPLAPDLRKQGMDWRFVQHDLRRVPLPFEDEEFDIVVMKDMSLVVPLLHSQKVTDEAIRVLKRGGTFEIWDCDHTIRSILPHPPPPPGKHPEYENCAAATGTFMISPITPFAPVQNKYLHDSNAWIEEALDRRKLPAQPCTRVTQVLLQEPDLLCDIEYRRVAIPLGELRWERDSGERFLSQRRESEAARGKARAGETVLTEDQAALRYTALLTVIQLIESMEPLLKEVSGKNQEEWQRWWGWMMVDLLEQKGASSGECLELGAWWARKI
ncbi:SAM binding motif-containing protein [Patellaria atrata CBS 101060]|uniref:SAM binding motif-containing protein n=1 Tax=Patellaria atrata CBS 101060 TaxID=1346257 RepID=A0A9P4VLR2_9PEZI|nr:SAM binding motif-containing protein [Patellaria atrata CBS 101060]